LQELSLSCVGRVSRAFLIALRGLPLMPVSWLKRSGKFAKKKWRIAFSKEISWQSPCRIPGMVLAGVDLYHALIQQPPGIKIKGSEFLIFTNDHSLTVTTPCLPLNLLLHVTFTLPSKSSWYFTSTRYAQPCSCNLGRGAMLRHSMPHGLCPVLEIKNSDPLIRRIKLDLSS
jgi:hypothetical protein